MSSRKNETAAVEVSTEAREFRNAANEGNFLIRACLACGEKHFYPRPHCPVCGSRETEWRKSSGAGEIHSFTIMAGAKRATAPAIIDLEDGLRLSSVILDADVHQLGIGDPVIVSFDTAAGGVPALAFTTPQAEAARGYSKKALASVLSENASLGSGALSEEIRLVAIIGAGNMGIGIATAFAKSGFSVLLIDQSEEALAGAMGRIGETLDRDVSRKRLSGAEASAIIEAVSTSTDMARVANADLVVEAVWEQMELKKAIFAEVDKYAREDVCLCSNTSTLDIDEIAGATGRPDKVVGLHFFNPAHVMKLLEIVRGAATSPSTLAVATQIGERLGKVPVVVGNAYGFVGNRLMIAREREAARMLLEGALPHQIDAVLTRFGMPMGTFEMQDMAGGIELSYRRRQATGEKNFIIDRLFEAGRLGQKTGKGYYRYQPGRRRPVVDSEVTAIIEEASKAEGIQRRPIGDQEIEDRLILPMINEGAKLVEEGIALRPSDIDIAWQYGFGWPSWKGGPMYHADRMGLDVVFARLRSLHDALGDPFAPCGLLQEMADAKQSFTGRSFPDAA